MKGDIVASTRSITQAQLTCKLTGTMLLVMDDEYIAHDDDTDPHSMLDRRQVIGLWSSIMASYWSIVQAIVFIGVQVDISAE